MPLFRHLCQVIVCATLATRFAHAHSGFPTQLPGVAAPVKADISEVESRSYLDQLLSLRIFRFFAPAFPTVSEFSTPELHLQLTLDEDPVPACSVSALPEVEDIQALGFENRMGPLGAVDLDGLTPSTALALARFQRMVSSAGGAMEVTSAYRPATYQEHLRSVWDKWILELRYNHDPLCQNMRAQVQEEFTRHSLLESQRPVVFSDHTRGLSFDAAVRLPKAKRGRRAGVDTLARLAGVRRPDIAHDPVHFKLAM